jgi:thiamine-monophosphate kinase
MYQLNEILENKIINNLIEGFERSPDQLNNPHESDAEIIQVGDLKLAVTTDSISEEISTGLYDDPYLVGWMIVTVNISDLAAVGAKPIGILISEIITKDFSNEKLLQLQEGISDACKKYNTYILGGDTNEGEDLVLTGTAIGIINNEKILSRVGCKAGDLLYSSGKLGIGNAFAISKLISKTITPINFRPEARVKLSSIINKYATACMDTSDGLIAALDQLMRLNEVGFELTKDFEKIIDEDSLNFVKNLNIPSWLLFAGQHGEFELVFTIPRSSQRSFLDDAEKIGFEPVELGKVGQEEEIRINLYDKSIPINSGFIRNLPYKTNGDVNHYLKLLLEYDSELKKSPNFNFTTT